MRLSDFRTKFNVMTPPSRKVVAGEVRAALARADITQGELAGRIGMSPTALSERLSGRRPFNTDHLHAIGQALGIDPISLLTPPASSRTEASA